MTTLTQDKSSQAIASQPQTSTFHPFPRLPTEIRTLIFHYAALSIPSRIIEVHYPLEKSGQLPESWRCAEKLIEIARSRTKCHSARARTPTLFHVNSHARAVALALYRPCKAANFVLEFPWISALAPYMEEPVPPLGGSVFDPSKDTLFVALQTSYSHGSLISHIQYPAHLIGIYSNGGMLRWGLEYLAGDLAAVAHIESLAIRCRHFNLRVHPDGLGWLVRVLKKYENLRELILVACEDSVPCDVSRGLGLEIRRREVILLDGKDLVNEMWTPVLERAIQIGEKCRDAIARVQARDDDRWKAPEIKVKIARRGT